MVWAACPTHGPIQDASTSTRGTEVSLWCRCGLECSHFEPQSFVEHEELKTLAETNTQPREDHVVPDAPKPTPKRKPKAKPKAKPKPVTPKDDDGDPDASDD